MMFYLRDRRQASDITDEQLHALRENLMCTMQIMKAALALSEACVFEHHRMHVSYPPSMAFPIIQLSIRAVLKMKRKFLVFNNLALTCYGMCSFGKFWSKEVS